MRSRGRPSSLLTTRQIRSRRNFPELRPLDMIENTVGKKMVWKPMKNPAELIGTIVPDAATAALLGEIDVSPTANAVGEAVNV